MSIAENRRRIRLVIFEIIACKQTNINAQN